MRTLAILLLALASPAFSAVDYGSARLDANRLDFPLSNVGIFGNDPSSARAAFFYPKASGRSCLYSGGLWIGAKVAGETRLAIADFSTEYGPGPMNGTGWYGDVPAFHTYRVSRGDTTGTADWLANGAPLGAPTSGGAPLLLGSQTLWAIYNDANPLLHGATHAGGTNPLGVEVDQLAWSYEELSARRDVAFLRYRLRNGSAQAYDSVYVALWADVDLGGASDDRMGSDRARNLVYTYNGAANDNVYGTTPPAIAFKLLDGPAVSATNTYIGGIDPDTSIATWGLLRGRRITGDPWIDPASQVTTFPYDGDPVTGTGWTEPLDAELRMMIVSGPFTMAPGDTQSLTYAIVVGQGANHLASITRMRAIADSIDLAAAYAPLAPIPPAPPSHVLSFAPPPSPSRGPLSFSTVAPIGETWRLDAYDVRGRRVERVASGVGSGFEQVVPWAPQDLASGVYFVRLSTNTDRVTHRVVVFAP